MRADLAKVMGYHEQPIQCCAICKHVAYSKTMCKKVKELKLSVGNAAVCPTGICEHFELRSADQDKKVEDVEWMP